MTRTTHAPVERIRARAQRRRGRRAAAAVALATACGQALALVAGAPAQQAPTATAFTGRDFAGVTLPAQPQKADVTLAGRRAWTWLEGPRIGGTRRVYLDGDARVQIGPYHFNAEAATVWIELVQADGRPLQQVAVYLETVRDSGADAGVAQSAAQLLVTAIVEGDVALKTDLLHDARPDAPLVAEGEARLARYLVAQSGGQGGAGTPGPVIVEAKPTQPTDVEVPPGLGDNLPPRPQSPPIFAQRGVVTFFGPDRTLVTGKEENALVITGGVVLQYTDVDRRRTLQISAQSLVAFLKPGTVAESLRFGPQDVRGVYLEGDVVATDGSYTLRGPRFYYDIVHNRGAALDAVFWSYDKEKGLPLYVRAAAIRQESANQWSAGRATLANSEFFDPVFTIGASSVTLTRTPGADGTDRDVVDAKDVTLNVGGTPVFYVPRYEGEPTGGVALRRLSVGHENGDTVAKTRWDLISLLGADRPEGLSADLLLEQYFNHGPAVGADLRWTASNADGSFFSYYAYDDGQDRLTSGALIPPATQNRTLQMGEHRWRLDDQWTLFLEGSYVSDPTFVDAYFPDLARTRREFTNSIYARYLTDNSVFSAQVRGTFNDFTPNQYLLQSLGYQVEKLPELEYWRVNDQLFGGAITYNSETRLSNMKQVFNDPTSAQLGYNTTKRSEAAFGLAPNQSLADRLSAEGYTEDAVLRLDSRHEFSAPIAAGPFNITPFAVGRATLYNNDFADFRPPGATDDKARFWGSAGVTVSTTITRVDNSVKSELFDVDRIRHIIEPSVTVWSGWTTIPRKDLPIYDELVESIGAGTALRAAVRNTWQTKRAGPDGERSVDWITLNLAYVNSADNTDQKTPIGRWFDSRPEQSVFGDYSTAEGMIRLTDAVAITGTAVYDFNLDNFSAASGGLLLDHGHGFTSFAEVRRLQPVDSTLVGFGAAYELTKVYAVEGYGVFDVSQSTFQSSGLRITRRSPQWTAQVGIGFDNITGEATLNFQLQPAGLGGDDRARVFTREEDVLGRPTPAPLPNWGR